MAMPWKMTDARPPFKDHHGKHALHCDVVVLMSCVNYPTPNHEQETLACCVRVGFVLTLCL